MKYANSSEKAQAAAAWQRDVAHSHVAPVHSTTTTIAGHEEAPGSSTVHITGLPPGTSPEQLSSFFQGYGQLTAKVLDDGHQGSPATALLRLSVKDAERLQTDFDGHLLQGLERPLSVRIVAASSSERDTSHRFEPYKVSVRHILTVLGEMTFLRLSYRISRWLWEAFGKDFAHSFGGFGTAPKASSVSMAMQMLQAAETAWPAAAKATGPPGPSPASPEFMAAISETVSRVKGFKPVVPQAMDPTNLYIKGLPSNADEWGLKDP